MKRRSNLSSKRVFKSTDFENGPLVLTISGIEKEKVPTEEGPDEQKYLVAFQESPLRSSLTARRERVLKALFGNSTKNAIGKQIELFSQRCRFKGKPVAVVAFRAPGGETKTVLLTR